MKIVARISTRFITPQNHPWHVQVYPRKELLSYWKTREEMTDFLKQYINNADTTE